MIIQFLNKVNTSTEKMLKKYENQVNYGDISCPICNSKNLVKNGTYQRNIIFLIENDRIETNMKIQRFKCKNCGKTHALLPEFVVPYKQFSLLFIIEILNSILVKSLNKTSITFNVSRQIIYFWKNQFKKHHKSRLISFTENDINLTFSNIRQNIYDFYLNYNKKYNIFFMQHIAN